jgi:hypothetical protein
MNNPDPEKIREAELRVLDAALWWAKLASGTARGFEPGTMQRAHAIDSAICDISSACDLYMVATGQTYPGWAPREFRR